MHSSKWVVNKTNKVRASTEKNATLFPLLNETPLPTFNQQAITHTCT